MFTPLGDQLLQGQHNPDSADAAMSLLHVPTAGLTSMDWTTVGGNRLAHSVAAFAPFVESASAGGSAPEPSTYVLAAAGLLGLGLMGRRRKRGRRRPPA